MLLLKLNETKNNISYKVIKLVCFCVSVFEASPSDRWPMVVTKTQTHIKKLYYTDNNTMMNNLLGSGALQKLKKTDCCKREEKKKKVKSG